MLDKMRKKDFRDKALALNLRASTQYFNIEAGKNPKQGTYQTLRLHYDPLLENQKNTVNTDPNDKRKCYEHLRFTGVGGLTGKQKIWKESLLYKIKQANPRGIKMAIGITMYNEDWQKFIRTITGIC